MQYTATASSRESVSFAVETLPQAFASIPDPRRKQGTRARRDRPAFAAQHIWPAMQQ